MCLNRNMMGVLSGIPDVRHKIDTGAINRMHIANKKAHARDLPPIWLFGKVGDIQRAKGTIVSTFSNYVLSRCRRSFSWEL